MADQVQVVDEYVIGPEYTPFFTKRWVPVAEPRAYIVFVHGMAEHIARYDHFFRKLAAAPHNLHVFAYDQRGHGKTSYDPVTETAHDVAQWKADGQPYKLEKNAKRKTGGWAKALPEMEFFVKRESNRAHKTNGKLFLYGHSMGGGQVLAFGLRAQNLIQPKTLDLLSGIISSGPMIRQTTPASFIQVKAGSLAANLLPNMIMKIPLDVKHFTHDVAQQDLAANDPYNEPIGSLRGLSDMLSGGVWLDSPAAWNGWQKHLPLLLYHGGDDPITDPKATVRFGEKVTANDKTTKIWDGLLHEVHNESEPFRTEAAEFVAAWIEAHLDGPVPAAEVAVASQAVSAAGAAEENARSKL
ncbi:hypothetical protein Q8F55_002473 [Vanrija albida]|uniref:Serine aminopeptidase S33 domain-containing protein n=1 Tax=Vanrija albida TaxID=181172 RepID=A0ABR3QAG6_9TREE